MLSAMQEQLPAQQPNATESPAPSTPASVDRPPMLHHADVWRGIDRLAAKHGLSASGLARRAGLDPTAFNPSKRITRQGRARWPSTESVAKILSVTGETLSAFVSLTGAIGTAADQATRKLNGRVAVGRSIPVILLSKLLSETCFDHSGQPAGNHWGKVMAPAIGDREVFAVEINTFDFEPVYRNGDLVIASLDSEIRRGDRVLIGCADDTVKIVRVGRQDNEAISVEPITNNTGSMTLRNIDIRWIARIVWASQ